MLDLFLHKNKQSSSSDSFEVPPVNFSLQQLSKSTSFYIFKLQDINSSVCGTSWLYGFYVIEKINQYDAVLEIYSL